MNRCKRCALPESYPGIRIAADSCNYCIYFDFYKNRETSIKSTLADAFNKIISSTKQTNRSKYDCIVAYSGGKDSTFLLKFLKEKYGLNILAHTLDNGFISPTAFDNINQITNRLKIDNLTTTIPSDIATKIFKFILTEECLYPKEILAMMSPLCATCQGMVFGTTLRIAIERQIPLMFIGYTPGQYPAISLENFLKVHSCIFLSSQVHKDDPIDIIKIGRDPINKRFGNEIDKYYFPSQYVDSTLIPPKILFPFHVLMGYNEKQIFEEIKKIGWKMPKDTDPCSTNCLLNALANYACVKQLNYHPYAGEISFLLRDGQISYEDAIRFQDSKEIYPGMVFSLNKLGLNLSDLETLNYGE